MNFYPIEHAQVKHAFTTHAVPLAQMAGTRELEQAPQAGDLILAEVLSTGHHKRLEQRNGSMLHIFPGDLIMGAFGNRYATDQFEAYVPKQPVAECDLVSGGGVCGEVVSRHPSMDTPTRLRILGGVCDSQGWSLNLRSFGLPARRAKGGFILVVGSAMNSGKTTAVGTIARALKKGGFRPAAAKVTGTAAGKDARYFVSCGARPVLDFTHAGYPSTYMATLEELLAIQHTLIGHLQAAENKPEYIVIEVADGIFQRETRMLLENEEFRQNVDHVFFAASDSLSAECGARCLKIYGLPLRALVGSFTQSALALREAEAATGIRCLNIEQMVSGGVLEAMGLERPASAEVPVQIPAVLAEHAFLSNSQPFYRNGEASVAARIQVSEESGQLSTALPG